MTVNFDIACKGKKNLIYGISSIDNKVYECDLDFETCKLICDIPVAKDGWFSISYCNEKIFLTTTDAKKIYMISLKNKKLSLLDWENKKEATWGFFVVTIEKKVYFFYRNPFFLLVYNTEKECFLDEEQYFNIEINKIENISVYKNIVVLFNISESKVVVIDLLNNYVVSRFTVPIKIMNLTIVRNQIYIISNTKMFLFDLYGNIVKSYEMPIYKQNQKFSFLDAGDKVGIYDCWGRCYTLDDKFKQNNNISTCLTSIVPTGEQILKKIILADDFNVEYWIYNKEMKTNSKYLFKLPSSVNERKYKQNFVMRGLFFRENKNGIGNLSDYLKYVIIK